MIERLVAFLLAPLAALRPEQSLIIGTGVTEAFFTKLKVAVIAGIFLSSPILFYQAWRFVAPGLYEREKRVALPFSAASLLHRGRLVLLLARRSRSASSSTNSPRSASRRRSA